MLVLYCVNIQIFNKKIRYKITNNEAIFGISDKTSLRDCLEHVFPIIWSLIEEI